MSSDQGSQDPDFPYTHLWASKDGETHIAECKLKGFDLKKYSSEVQKVKNGPEPSKIVFTQLDVGSENPWHCCPQVQFVATLSGKW